MSKNRSISLSAVIVPRAADPKTAAYSGGTSQFASRSSMRRRSSRLVLAIWMTAAATR